MADFLSLGRAWRQTSHLAACVTKVTVSIWTTLLFRNRNFPPSPDVFISQSIRYAMTCSSYFIHEISHTGISLSISGIKNVIFSLSISLAKCESENESLALCRTLANTKTTFFVQNLTFSHTLEVFMKPSWRQKEHVLLHVTWSHATWNSHLRSISPTVS